MDGGLGGFVSFIRSLRIAGITARPKTWAVQCGSPQNGRTMIMITMMTISTVGTSFASL